MKQTYLRRAIISGLLFVAMVSLGAYAINQESSQALVLIPAIIFSVLFTRSFMDSVSAITGFTFFLSIPFLIGLYVIFAMFALVLAPIYCVWNVGRFFLSKE